MIKAKYEKMLHQMNLGIETEYQNSHRYANAGDNLNGEH